MNILNAALNYLVIFQPFPFFLKGVSGIAWCSNISRGVALICIIICLFRLPLQLDFHKMRPKSLLKIKEILRVGLPGGISSLSYNVSQTVTTSVIALVGVSAISTKIYVSNLVFYVYVLGLSLGMSTSLLIGWLCGAKKYDQAYRLNLQNLKVTILLNATLSILLFLFGRPLLSLFTKAPVQRPTG